MIFNLRGGNGSGKSTVHRHLVDTYAVEELHSANFRSAHERKPNAFRLRGDLYVVGRYTAGADGISFGELQDLVRAFATRGHVFFENVLVSANLRSWLPVRDDCAKLGHDWVWATLDTPLEVCLARIQARNGGKPVKENAISQHHNRVKKYARVLEEMGENAVWIDHTRSIGNVEEVLRANGWAP